MSSGVNGQFYGLSALWSYLSGYKKDLVSHNYQLWMRNSACTQL